MTLSFDRPRYTGSGTSYHYGRRKFVLRTNNIPAEHGGAYSLCVCYMLPERSQNVELLPIPTVIYM